jgi:hypothetical protein
MILSADTASRLWGNPEHLKNVAKVLRERYTEDKLHILVAKRNSGSFTYDGIELGGERVCQEIEEEIEKLGKDGQVIKKLSVVGYSLGGLVARYAIGLLDSKGLFEKIEPVVSKQVEAIIISRQLIWWKQNFTTFATPHLGVRSPLRSFYNRLFNIFGARTLSMSGHQLFLIDDFRSTGRPLLSVLADPNSIFIKGLRKFKRRTLYCNIVNDHSATYYTTGIYKTDPFVDLDAVKINYVPGTEDVIVDPSQPVAPKFDTTALTLYSRTTALVNGVPLFLALVLFVPIGTIAFLINSGIQTVSSTRRIKLHEAGQAGIDLSSYRMPFITDIREAVEDVYENLNNAQSAEYLPVSSDEESAHSEILFGDDALPSNPDRNGNGNGSGSSNRSGEKTALARRRSSVSRHGGLETQTLALTEEQFAMIDVLDEVGWRKFPVYIHKVRHSHAAIIVRTDKAGFSEGYVVLKHWLDEQFLLQ